MSTIQSMSDEKEADKNKNRKEFEKDNYLSPSMPNLIPMDSTSAAMPLSTSTTATLLQAYAARLSSDSDYARYVYLQFLSYYIKHA